MPPVDHRPPHLLTRLLAVWIAAALLAGAGGALGGRRGDAPQPVSSALPPVHVTTPSLPPVTVPGVDLPPVTVPQVDVEVHVGGDAPPTTAPPATLRPEVTGPVLDLVAGSGSPVAIDRTGLWLVDADTGGARVLFNGATLNEVAFAPDGRRAAVTTYDGPERNGIYPLTLWVVDLATGARHVAAGPRIGINGPSWSPDGTLVAYQDYWDGEHGPFDQYVDGIWVVHPDGTGRHRVAGTDQYGGHFSWSPDSRWITGSLFNDDRVLVAAVDGSAERRHPATDPAYAEWSPAGGLLAVSTTFDGPLSVMDPVTGSTRVIATDLWGPTWSPDGAWIAAEGDDPGEGTFLLRPDGSGRRHVSANSLRGWSTDGRYLLLGGYGLGQSVLDLQTGQERVISNRPTVPALDWISGGFVPGTHRAAMLVFP